MNIPLLAGTRSDVLLQAIGRAALKFETYDGLGYAVLHVRIVAFTAH